MIHFQFDLRHVDDHGGLHVTLNDRTFGLTEHSPVSRQSEGRLHGALQHLAESIHPRFTHFASLDDAALGGDAVSWIRVCRKSADVPIDTLVLVAQYIPEHHLRAFYRRQSRMPGGVPRLYSQKLHEYGLHELPQDESEAIELLLSARTLISSRDTAASLLAHHPALASLQPFTAARIMQSHILSREQANDLQTLAGAIEKAGKDWCPVVRCKDMPERYDLLDDDGTLVVGKDEPLFTWDLHESVFEALKAPIARALKTASNDRELRNRVWSPAVGRTAKMTDAEAHPTEPAAPMRSAGTPAYKWTVTEETDHYGVSVDPSSIRISAKDELSIACSNSYSRTLYVGYRRKINEEFETSVQKLHHVNATNDIMGIPIPTLPTQLELNLKGASEVELLMGSLGQGDWTDPVSDTGANLTYLFQYGVPAIFLLGGAWLKSTETFRTILADKELVNRIIVVVASVGLIGSGVDYGDNRSFGMLSKFANFTFGIILSKGVEKLGKWVLEKAGKKAFTGAVMGPVGLLFKVAGAGVSIARMAVTTDQVLSSPATVRIRVSRAIDVSLTLRPDPEHGEQGRPETAVWPSVATRYLVTFQYIDGTGRQLSGPLDRTTNNKPLHLLFKDVPAGGRFRITAGVYSDTNWLAGTWQSDWQDCIPNHDTTLNMGEFTIVENLVPLSPDTQYQYKEEIQFAGGTYRWREGSPSQATIHALHGGDGGTISELVNISLNNSAYQIGFAWKASGQNLHENRLSEPRTNKQLYAVQNLSVLAEPGSRLISSEIGFTNQVRTAYAAPRGERIDQHNFVLDPRSGHLRHVRLDESSSFGFEHEQLSWGRFPLPHVDALAVHPGNLVIACSFKESKMMVLRLPNHGVADEDAPEALLVSGEGVRQGLMKGPRAMAIAPDGSILVLESLNNRVQAFDVKGNPVPCFTPNEELFQLNTEDITTDLDGGRIPQSFAKSLADFDITWCATIEKARAAIASLNAGSFGDHQEVLAALALEGVYISHDPQRMNEREVSPVLHAERDVWTITDPRGQIYRLLRHGDDIDVYELPARCQVEVQTPGKQWLITDNYLGMAWKLTPSIADAGKTIVKEALSHFPIPRSVTYLDMAVEAAGHIYVSYYRNDGSRPSDYRLQVYTPKGQLLLESPGEHAAAKSQNIVAGKFDVDIWRNLYALSFAPMPGLDGRVQPGIMHWTPTPPLFSLPLAAQKDLNDRNDTAVERDFQEKGVRLDPPFSITVIDPRGYWEVKDSRTLYHLYRSGDAIEVYSAGTTTA